MNRRTLGCAIGLFLALVWGAYGEKAEVRAAPFAVKYDLSKGALDIWVNNGKPLVRVASLARVTFADGQTLDAADMKAQTESKEPLRVVFTHPRAELAVSVEKDGDRLLFHARVSCKRGVIERVGVPTTFALSGKPRTRFLWPQTLGVELNESFLGSNRRLQTRYPSAFCDFCAAEIAGTLVYFYRCEPEDKPRSSLLTIRGGDPPWFSREFEVCLREGEQWSPPAMALQIGGGLRETLLRYKRECGLGKRLEEKMSPEFSSRWKAMAQANTAPPFSEATRTLRALPLPAVIEPNAWMFGGFDRKYPDFLPPNPSQGGEPAFREYIRVAHECGHRVSPYVNCTWWCAGWDGGGSAPAPSLVKYGDVALSRDADGKPQYEKYNGNFGYRVCPAHPVAIQRRREVRDALLDDYRVDFIYEDQLGARAWTPDFNPALENPADYGWALMQIGREDARRCPFGTEWGHDRVLDFAIMLNYWVLPPLSPVNQLNDVLPGVWRGDIGRSFPYSLFLSTGDAIVYIPDTTAPDRLAWSLLLGGRVSLGTINEGIERGPERETAQFLQSLAKALAPRAMGDRLLKFEYLAPRVARSTFERHSVLANFDSRPWPLEDGGSLAPDGFDLRAADGFRAGRYADKAGNAVLAFVDPSERAATTLAPGAFEVQIGSDTVRMDFTAPKRTIAGRQTAALDFGARLGAINAGGQTPDSIAAAFEALSPERIRSIPEFERALRQCRVIVNPHSEHLPVRSIAEWPADVERLRQWLESGGVWVEIGGHPLWLVSAPASEAGGWTRKTVGKAGFESLCAERCQLSPRRRQPPEKAALRLTDLGRAVLSRKTAEALLGAEAFVTRPPLGLDNTRTLIESDAGAYVVVHPFGYGAVVRIGGVPVGPAVTALAETIAAILDGRLDLGAPVWRSPLCRRIELHASNGAR